MPAQRAVYLARLGAPDGERVEPANQPSALDMDDLESRYPGLFARGSDLRGINAQELSE